MEVTQDGNSSPPPVTSFKTKASPGDENSGRTRRSTRISSGRVKIMTALNLLNIKQEPLDSDSEEEDNEGSQLTPSSVKKLVKEVSVNLGPRVDEINREAGRSVGESQQDDMRKEKSVVETSMSSESDSAKMANKPLVEVDEVVALHIEDSGDGAAQKILQSISDIPIEVAELLGSCIEENAGRKVTSVVEENNEQEKCASTNGENENKLVQLEQISLEMIDTADEDLQYELMNALETESKKHLKKEIDSLEESESVEKQDDEVCDEAEKENEKQDDEVCDEAEKENQNEPETEEACNIRMNQLISKYLMDDKVKVDENRRIYKCLPCDKVFKACKRLYNHLMLHEGAFRCNKCDRKFSCRKRLDNHVCLSYAGSSNFTRTNRDSYKCNKCDKEFSHEDGVRKHMLNHMDGYTCDKCGLVFVRKPALDSHSCDSSADRKQQPDKVDNRRRYSCVFCGRRFETEKYLMRHMASHSEDFMCHKCNKSFARKETLMLHLLACDPVQLQHRHISCFPCCMCKKVFTKELSLHNHMRKHTGEFRCLHCHKEFTNNATLQRHRCHASTVPPGDGLQCHECGKHFGRRKQLVEHMALHTGQFSCYICNQSFLRKFDLVRHTLICSARLQQQKTGLITCTQCELQFTDPRAYQEHYTEHTHPYKCSKCGKLYKLQIHLESHRCQGVTLDFVCGVCGRQFMAEKYLNKHLQVHRSKPYSCATCSRRFARSTFIYGHVCVDENGKRVRVYRRFDKEEREVIEQRLPQRVVCPICGKSFHNTSNLTKHMITHGEKKEQCTICKKKFHLKVALKAHRDEVHTTIYRYQCKYCSKRMKSRNSLYGHISQFHNDSLTMWTCTDCGKTFRQKGNLKKHSLTHKAAHRTAYKCQHCVRSFRLPEQLRRHRAVHVELEGTYSCEYCTQLFEHALSLLRHLQQQHATRSNGTSDEWGKSYLKSRRLIVTEPEVEEVVSVKEEESVESGGPMLLAQIEGPDGTKVQTVVIQAPPGTHIDTENLSPEIYDVLKNLSANAGNTDGVNNIILTQLKAEVQNSSSLGIVPDDGYYVVPLATADKDNLKPFKVSADTINNTDNDVHILMKMNDNPPGNDTLMATATDNSDEPFVAATDANHVVLLDGDKEMEVAVDSDGVKWLQIQGDIIKDAATGSTFLTQDDNVASIVDNNAYINPVMTSELPQLGQTADLLAPLQLAMSAASPLAAEQQQVLIQIDAGNGQQDLNAEQMQVLVQQLLLQQLQQQGSSEQQQQIGVAEQVLANQVLGQVPQE